MRIYLSDINLKSIMDIREKLDEDYKPHVLKAYEHRPNHSNVGLFDLIENKHELSSLMCDSGLYVMKEEEKRNKVTFDYNKQFELYSEFIDEYGSYIDLHVAFDAEFEADDCFHINKVYYERMLRYGLKPLYVIHNLSRVEVDYLLNMTNKPEYVAIASARLKSEQDFNKANDIVKDFYKHDIRTHLLGCCSYNRLMKTSAWSCDASSYGRWSSFGRAIFYSENEKKEVTLALSQFTKEGMNADYYQLPEMQDRRHEYENFIGLPFDEIAADSNNLVVVNAYYMKWLEERITNIQKSKGLVFSEW